MPKSSTRKHSSHTQSANHPDTFRCGNRATTESCKGNYKYAVRKTAADSHSAHFFCWLANHGHESRFLHCILLYVVRSQEQKNSYYSAQSNRMNYTTAAVVIVIVVAALVLEAVSVLRPTRITICCATEIRLFLLTLCGIVHVLVHPEREKEREGGRQLAMPYDWHGGQFAGNWVTSALPDYHHREHTKKSP